jgi:hypothetical protein
VIIFHAINTKRDPEVYLALETSVGCLSIAIGCTIALGCFHCFYLC